MSTQQERHSAITDKMCGSTCAFNGTSLAYVLCMYAISIICYIIYSINQKNHSIPQPTLPASNPLVSPFRLFNNNFGDNQKSFRNFMLVNNSDWS